MRHFAPPHLTSLDYTVLSVLTTFVLLVLATGFLLTG